MTTDHFSFEAERSLLLCSLFLSGSLFRLLGSLFVLLGSCLLFLGCFLLVGLLFRRLRLVLSRWGLGPSRHRQGYGHQRAEGKHCQLLHLSSLPHLILHCCNSM